MTAATKAPVVGRGGAAGLLLNERLHVVYCDVDGQGVRVSAASE